MRQRTHGRTLLAPPHHDLWVIQKSEKSERTTTMVKKSAAKKCLPKTVIGWVGWDKDQAEDAARAFRKPFHKARVFSRRIKAGRAIAEVWVVVYEIPEGTP
jgi:hypothetical protein